MVIPVLNQARLLPMQLEAVAQQTYRGEWELIVVDGSSTDGSLSALDAWDRPDVPVKAVTTHRGLNHQRNVGARMAAGDFLAFCDADDRASPGWLDALARAAPTADIIGGALEFGRLNDPAVRRWRNDEPSHDLEVHHGFLRTIPGGNCGIWRDVAQDIGWDESFHFGSSDIEFSWRAQMGSYRVAFSPDVVMHIRHRATVSGLAYQWFRYGHSGGRLYRKFRQAGMPRTPREEWLRDWRWLIAQLPKLRRQGPHRAAWVRIAAFRLGRVIGSLRVGVVFP